jgi:hypothetical protein
LRGQCISFLSANTSTSYRNFLQRFWFRLVQGMRLVQSGFKLRHTAVQDYFRVDRHPKHSNPKKGGKKQTKIANFSCNFPSHKFNIDHYDPQFSLVRFLYFKSSIISNFLHARSFDLIFSTVFFTWDGINKFFRPFPNLKNISYCPGLLWKDLFLNSKCWNSIWLKSDPRSAPHFFFIADTRGSEETTFGVTSQWPLYTNIH